MKTLNWVKIDSSNINSVAHKNEELYVEFSGGSQYKYKLVPEKLYNDLLVSESKGIFLNEQVKGTFEYENIS